MIYNSAEFGGSPLIDMPELHVEYDRDALVARKIHCKLLRFNLAQINIVEDKNGRRNLDSLEAIAQPRHKFEARQANLSGDQFAGIDTLNLTLGKVTYLRHE